ncbi:MAG: VCBS repeat-containing protein [Gemmataceae bacterium]|nr:VCBS repeat-containing protein [Gemmataceae bacterium]
MTAMRIRLLLALSLVALAAPRPAFAYIEAPHSFGQVLAQSTNIMLIRVEAVDKEKNLIIYRKVKDIKGVHPQEVIKHNIGRGGLRPNEWKPTMDWAEPGKIACMFHNGGLSETCIGNWWYQTSAGGEWWNHVHAEPFLLRSYAGPPEKLASIVPAMMEGKEVIVPCMVDGNKEDLHNRSAKIQRLKVSLKIQDYNPKRDFVGWGGEEFRRVLGMPGFSLISALPRVDPDALAISSVDLDGDGKLDLCLVGGGKIVILQNNGDSLSEISLPGIFGARSAVWADYNGDGKADLFLATATGPRLYTNLGGTLRDDSQLLPQDGPWNLTAAAWIDYDGDGKPDLLLANGWHGMKLLRNVGMAAAKVAFLDVTKTVGLDEATIGSLRGESLTVADVDGDARPDFLLGAGQGMLFLNQKGEAGGKFVASKDAGIAFDPRRAGPVFGDFDGDGALDLFVPQKTGGKLFKNDGKGKFADVSAKTIPFPQGWVTSAAWGDFDNDGQLDLILGCLKGPNRFLRNKGDGTFEDAGAKIGLDQRIYNTQAITVGDFNNDGVLDVACNNEGQDSCLLMGNIGMLGKKTPIALRILGAEGLIGSRVRVLDKEGKQLAMQQISGGDGRGGQQSPIARFVLDPGAYEVEVRYSSGSTRRTPVTVGADPMRTQIDPATAAANKK